MVDRTPVPWTLMVVLVYIAGVVALQALFGAFTGQRSQLAVVVSTLVIAALLDPIRRRLQSLIDQRVHRRELERRYPA